jgi:hypothetical protein
MNCKFSDIFEQFQMAGKWGQNLHKVPTFALKLIKYSHSSVGWHIAYMIAEVSTGDCGAAENAR